MESVCFMSIQVKCKWLTGLNDIAMQEHHSWRERGTWYSKSHLTTSSLSLIGIVANWYQSFRASYFHCSPTTIRSINRDNTSTSEQTHWVDVELEDMLRFLACSITAHCRDTCYVICTDLLAPNYLSNLSPVVKIICNLFCTESPIICLAFKSQIETMAQIFIHR